MKKFLVLSFLAVLLSGCGVLAPKKVEFFQKKVQAVPEVSEKMKETQRQAADYVARKTKETELAAVATDAAPEVVAPAADASVVAEALSDSMGPPEDPWKKEAARLAALLQAQEARFNAKLESYRQRTEKLEGKAIEDTGLIKVGYFSMWGLALGALALLWLAVKAYGLFNPVVGAGANVIGRVASKTLATGFRQVVDAGEKFKTYLGQSSVSDKEAVIDLFRRAHVEGQDETIRDLISRLTR